MNYIIYYILLVACCGLCGVVVYLFTKSDQVIKRNAELIADNVRLRAKVDELRIKLEDEI